MVFASKPLLFDKPAYQLEVQWVHDPATQTSINREVITAKLNISVAVVHGVVSFDKHGEIKSDQVMVPGAEPWFHVLCRNPQGASFEIISDGEKWYPIDPKTRRICHRQQPKRSLDFNEINQLDKMIVDAAIDHFMEQRRGK